MQTLILVLSFLMQHGVTLNMVEFETVWPDQQMYKEWDCHGFVDSEGTILACVTDRKIIVLPNKKP